MTLFFFRVSTTDFPVSTSRGACSSCWIFVSSVSLGSFLSAGSTSPSGSRSCFIGTPTTMEACAGLHLSASGFLRITLVFHSFAIPDDDIACLPLDSEKHSIIPQRVLLAQRSSRLLHPPVNSLTKLDPKGFRPLSLQAIVRRLAVVAHFVPDQEETPRSRSPKESPSAGARS